MTEQNTAAISEQAAPQTAARAGLVTGVLGGGVRVCVRGLGHYLPAAELTNDDLSRMVDTSDDWIVPRTGIRSRRVAAPEQATSDLAVAAGRAALEDAGLDPASIDLLVVATATPDTPVPSCACRVQPKLGLANAAGMDLSAACAGFVFATHTASAMIRAGMHRRALVIGAEILTRITDYTDRQSCILFGDGAGAVVLTAEDDESEAAAHPAAADLRLIYSRIRTNGDDAGLIEVAAGGSRLPASAATVSAHQHYLTLRGAEVFKKAVKSMADAAREALDELGLEISDLRWIFPHQANARIIQAVSSQLGAAPEQVIEDIAMVGNTSAASLPLAMSRTIRRDTARAKDRIMLLTFGAGTTWGCQVFERT